MERGGPRARAKGPQLRRPREDWVKEGQGLVFLMSQIEREGNRAATAGHATQRVGLGVDDARAHRGSN